MKHLRSSIMISILLALALCIAPTAAQDEPPSPLLEMLALVPDNAATQAVAPVVSYADYRVMESMRGITTPPLQSLDDLRTDEGQLWLWTMNGITAGLPLSNFRAFIEGMSEVVGFAFGDIDRTLIFGSPPSLGIVVGGDFDAEAIAAAYTARDFTQTTVGDIPVWCGPDGCTEGQKVDIQGNNPANPFGGDLGRNEPLAVLPGYLVDSADYSVVQNMLSTYQDTAPSLADNPAYGAVVEAVTEAGTLAQIIVMNFDDVGIYTWDMDTIDIREVIMGYGTLPPYSMFALADVWDGADQEITLLMLVYADTAQAEVATAELPQRLNSAVSLTYRVPVAAIIAERSGTIGEAYVYESTSGYVVAVLPVVAPVQSNERDPELSTFISSGRIYRLFTDLAYRRDLYFIASEIILPE